MVKLRDYLEDNPSFLSSEGLPFLEMAKRVKNQAIAHTRRDSQGEILYRRRPNETDEVFKYRITQHRMLTKEVYNNFIDLLSRVFAGKTFGIDNVSEVLQEDLDSNPYTIRGVNTDIKDFFFNCVLPHSLENPNSILVDIPFNTDDAEEPPINRRSNQGQIVVETSIISFEKIKRLDPFLVFEAGTKPIEVVGNNTKRTINLPYYFIADCEMWYRAIPTNVKEKVQGKETGKYVYEIQDWYSHDITYKGKKVVPINFLVGDLSTYTNEDGLEYKYNESLLHSFYEYADEFIGKHSDYQAVSVQHHHPKLMMREMDCPAPNCNLGSMTDATGKLVVPKKKCPHCNNGKIRTASPFNTLIVPDEVGMDMAKGLNPPIQYVDPPVSSIDSSKEHAFFYFDKGQKGLGMDILGSNVEDVKTKAMRLLKQNDVISKFFRLFTPFIQRHLWYKESLLNPNRDKRQAPRLIEPDNFINKDVQTLEEEAKNAIGADKPKAQLSFLLKRYEDNEELKKVYRLAYKFEPDIAFLDDDDYFNKLLDVGCIDCNDLIRIKNMVWAFEMLSEEDNFLDRKDIDLYNDALKLIEPKLKEVLQIQTEIGA